MIPGSQDYLNQSIAALLRQPAWDMFYLGGYHSPKRRPVYVDHALDRIRCTYETYAYSVNHTFFDVLLSSLKECKSKTDHFYIQKIHKKYNIFCCNPMVCRQSGGMSDITSRTMHTFARKHPLAVILEFPVLLLRGIINRLLWYRLFPDSDMEIIWPFTGGLGNQMFEAAHAVDFSHKMEKTPRFLDITEHTTIFRKWELGCFGITGETLSTSQRIILKYWIRTEKRLYMFRTWDPEISMIAGRPPSGIHRKILKYGVLAARRLQQASHKSFDPEILFEARQESWHEVYPCRRLTSPEALLEASTREEYYAGSLHPRLCIYLWQGERFFKDSAEQVKKIFTFPDIAEIPAGFAPGRSKPGVAVHIRRCDYIHQRQRRRHDLVCDVDWYRKALQKMREMVPGAIFYIFSDDQLWVQEQFGREPDVSLVRTDPDGPAWGDMALMARCQHFIIPNSTYSWWAVYLRKTKDSVIIAPRFWSRDPLTPTHEHPVYCEEWQLL